MVSKTTSAASKPQPVEKAQKSKTRENEQKAQCESEKCKVECAKVNGNDDRKKDLLEKLENVMDMEADAMITRMNEFMGNLDTFETLFEPFQSKIAKSSANSSRKCSTRRRSSLSTASAPLRNSTPTS